MHPYISRALAAEMIRDRYAAAAESRRARQARMHRHEVPAGRQAAPGTAAGGPDSGLRWYRRRARGPAVPAGSRHRDDLAA